MSVPRTRPPSDIKWLANELAATKGELERIDEELARLGQCTRLRALGRRLRGLLYLRRPLVLHCNTL